MALFTFGEGYHNYHHEFQHDYRNGVKPWQWDPTKWLIWILSKVGLTDSLRRVPSDTIRSAQERLRSHPPENGAVAPYSPPSVEDQTQRVRSNVRY